MLPTTTQKHSKSGASKPDSPTYKVCPGFVSNASPGRVCACCGASLLGMRPQALYCSDSCRKAAKRAAKPKAPSQSKVKRLTVKRNKLFTSAPWRWLVAELTRARTVEVLSPIKTKAELTALINLKRRATTLSAYVDSVPQGDWHLSHIASVAHPERLGCLCVANLVIAPKQFNLKHKALVGPGHGVWISRDSLEHKHRITPEMSNLQVFNKVRRYLGAEVVDGWLSSLSLPPTRRQQLVKTLKAQGLKNIDSMALDDLLALAERKSIEVFEFSKSAAEPLDVLIEELKRLQPKGSLLIAATWLSELLGNLDHLETKQDRELRDFILTNGWLSLHGCNYTLVFNNDHILNYIRNHHH